jgi:hypothetical protein
MRVAKWKCFWMLAVMVGVVGLGAGRASAQGPVPAAKDVVKAMVANDLYAAKHDHLYSYVAVTRAARTGGHWWTEHVVETPVGRVRFLMKVDDKPLTPEEVAQERGRLAVTIADPNAFEASEKAEKDDENRARAMLELLPTAFLLENMRAQGEDWRIDFRPDPNYSPSGVEDKVLCAMSGYMLITRQGLRLHHIEGSLANNVNIGFGLLATIHAGSRFETTKAPFFGEWRTVHVLSDIRGRAVLFERIAKNQEVTRSEFHQLEQPLSVAQAVALAEDPPQP